MASSLKRNKANVKAIYDLMFNQCRPREAIERFAGGEYRQHNPHVADGKEAFIEYFERMAEEYPGKRVDFVRAFADGDHVILHCHQTWPGSNDYAGIGHLQARPGREGRRALGRPAGHARGVGQRQRHVLTTRYLIRISWTAAATGPGKPGSVGGAAPGWR